MVVPGEPTLRPVPRGQAPTDPLVRRINQQIDRRVLIRNGCVISMDPAVGDFQRADVLFEGDTITQVGPNLDLGNQDNDVSIIDADGFIVMPGFVDTHRHMWQGQLRRMIPNVDISMYLGLRNSFAVQYEPDDNYVGTLATALGALYSGITSIQDYAHNTRSGEHADGEITALNEAGIRAVYACAPPEAGNWDRQWPEDLSRLKDALSDNPLLTLRMGQRCFSDEDNLTGERIRISRALGIGMTLDPVAWQEGTNAVLNVAGEGLLGPDLVFIHCFDLSDEAWKAMGEAQVGVSLSPFVDELLGWGPEGLPTVQRAMDVGIAPGLSVDIETTVPSDVFTQMRALLAVQRMRGSLGNTKVDRPQLTARDAVAIATAHGAQTIGLGATCGSLTPGKKADIVLIDCSTPNMFPLSNAYGAVALGADVNAVRAVIVSGVIKKWGYSLVDVDVDQIHEMLKNSRDALAKKVGFEIDLFADYPSIDLGTNTLRVGAP